MTKDEARRQLCKMQGEIADTLELPTACVCDHEINRPDEVPEEVIDRMWRILMGRKAGEGMTDDAYEMITKTEGRLIEYRCRKCNDDLELYVEWEAAPPGSAICGPCDLEWGDGEGSTS